MASVLLFGRLAKPITQSIIAGPNHWQRPPGREKRERDLLLLLLLVNYPHFVPYEVLYASFYHGYGHLSVQRIGKAWARLETLREERLWDAEMRPIRNVIGRLGLKGREMVLGSINVHEIGYLLIKRPKWHTS